MIVARTSTAREEGLTELSQVLDHLLGKDRDILTTVRRCIRVCDLLALDDAKAWFERELLGYPTDALLPSYRCVQAKRAWGPKGAVEHQRYLVDQMMTGDVAASFEPYSLRVSLEYICRFLEKDCLFATGTEETRYVKVLGQDVVGKEHITIAASTFRGACEQLETEIVRWASSAYATIRFGESVSDIWQSYRSSVDEKLAELGLTNILNQIQTGLASADPQQWRSAMYGCRDLLHDVAGYLWKDERPTYSKYNDDDGKPLAVTPDKHVNRLIAYLHCKGVAGSAGDYLRAEKKRLRKLQAFASKAHDQVQLDDARSVAIAVYVTIAEVIRRTDMEPVIDYD